jgi:hypothetical protein
LALTVFEFLVSFATVQLSDEEGGRTAVPSLIGASLLHHLAAIKEGEPNRLSMFLSKYWEARSNKLAADNYSYHAAREPFQFAVTRVLLAPASRLGRTRGDTSERGALIMRLRKLKPAAVAGRSSQPKSFLWPIGGSSEAASQTVLKTINAIFKELTTASNLRPSENDYKALRTLGCA